MESEVSLSLSVESHLNSQRGQITKLLSLLKFKPLTDEEVGENALRQTANRAEEQRVAELNKGCGKDDPKEQPNLKPLIVPHEQRLDTAAFEAALQPVVEMVLPCLDGQPDFNTIGRLFFWAPFQYQGADKKATRDRFLKIGIRQAGDYDHWFEELQKQGDNLIMQDATCEPIVAEIIARLHPLSAGKLAK